MRVDPTKLVPGAKSVISLLYNYFPQQDQSPPSKGVGGLIVGMPDARHADARQGDLYDENSLQTANNSLLTEENASSETAQPAEEERFKISRYAYGEDYHKVVRRKLKALVSDLKKEIGDFNARVFVDSAPVMERDWAKRSGQGWIGKNTLLIHPKKGSYFFLAEIILDVELEYDHPMRDHCGTCTRCIDACPTDAISPEGYILDGSKCISYLTIELKSQIPESFKGQMEDRIYGCDICQEVCPWNRFSTPHEEPAFEISEQLQEMKREDWLEITEEVFNELFSKSAVKRAGYEKLLRSICFLKS
ncbi:MAG: tRNA epoxyqueuosine(34) reductase QueG [Saprospiraceae bacterium]|nr:tRNA epoxyqueuosine(34) reductase QueG [Candidatus Opimibacter iunctus]